MASEIGGVKPPWKEARTYHPGEDAWVLLLNNETGQFYVQGPKGGPVVSGEADEDWTLPVTVSDKYYANASYSVLGI